MAPAEPGSAAPSNEEEEEEWKSTLLDLPGHPQVMAALETLQHYPLSVSNSDDAQMSMVSVEQFLTSKGPCTTQMTLRTQLSRVNAHIYVCLMEWRLLSVEAYVYTRMYLGLDW